VSAVQKLSVGRIVHFNSYEPLPSWNTRDKALAAIIVHVHDDETVNLVVFTELGDPLQCHKVKFGIQRGQWQWPPRV
jgi:hypothetical protein